MLTIYTISHFLVDFASGWALYHGAAYTDQGVICVILYNFLAFAMQMPLGLCADALNRNALCAATGCLLVGTACIVPAPPLAIATIAGLGNALFHLGGGLDVLNKGLPKYGSLGIFVSTGAFGIFYGCRLGVTHPELGILTSLTLYSAALLIALSHFRKAHTWRSGNAPVRLPSWNLQYCLAALCLFLVVILRSYMGFALSFAWKGLAPWGTLLLCALALGKMNGGLLADRWGTIVTVLGTLSAASVFFLLSDLPWAGVLAVWLFNMTMPLTLGALAAISPGCKGGAFGALTLGLFLGALPHLLRIDNIPHTPIVYALATIISMVLLLLGLRYATKCQ